MKTTAFNRSCYPLARPALPAAPRAHTPPRYPTGAARLAASELPFSTPGPANGPAASARSARVRGDRPQVLHVDMDSGAAAVLASLLQPEAEVTHVATLAEARRMLENEVFSLVVLDPALPDGDARALLPLLAGTPLLVYSAHQPEWRGNVPAFLPKPWTSARQLWAAISSMLGIASGVSAGD